MKIRIATCNVQNTPDISRAKVRRCGAIMASLDADVIGYQEIREGGEDFQDVRFGMGGGYEFVGDSHSTPIAVGDRLRMTGHEWYKFHDADGKIPTPERGATAAGLRPAWRTRPRVAAVNSHLINGAFNNQHLHTKQQRKLLWLESRLVLQGAMSDLYEENYNLIVMGDFNNRSDFALRVAGEEVRWIAGRYDIDKIGVVAQPGWRFTSGELRRVETPSDHDAIMVDVNLVRV